MNAQPQFTDYRGRKLKAIKRRRKLNVWTGPRIFVAAMMVIMAPMLMFGAVTAIDLASNQVKNLLGGANGGLHVDASAFTGVLREASGTASASELSGDATTSGSNAVTVAKVNGTTVNTNSAADQLIRTTGSAVATWATIPDCTAGALEYTQSTHAFSCGTVLTGTFADAEVPTGLINSSNTSYSLAHTPSPAGSLDCYLNGVEQRAGGADYSLSTATITYGTAPTTGSTLVCYYRY